MFGSTRMFFRITSLIVLTFLLLPAAMTSVCAQDYERELSISAKSLLTITHTDTLAMAQVILLGPARP